MIEINANAGHEKDMEIEILRNGEPYTMIFCSKADGNITVRIKDYKEFDSKISTAGLITKTSLEDYDNR